MSLYQIISMNIAMEKLNKKNSRGDSMGDEEFDALKDEVRAMNIRDVRI